MINEILGENGLFSQHIENYEVRKQQLDLSNKIYNCINSDLSLVAEAPTGTGKSYAYLIPAILKAKETGSKVVIATSNIALQEQLIGKDLPSIKKIIGGKHNFTFALAKGRNNFLCFDAQEETEMGNFWYKMSAEEQEKMKEINEWARKTKTGDKTELPFDPSYKLWERFSVGNDDCKKKSCRFFDDCFANIAKKAFHEADVIVCNYHLLLLDLRLKSTTENFIKLLPEFHYLICDEAHNIENIARECFSSEVKPRSITRITAALEKIKIDNKNPYKDDNDLSVKLKKASDNFFNNIIDYYKNNKKNYVRTNEKNIVSYEELARLLINAAEEIEDHADVLEKRNSDEVELLRARANEARKIKNAIVENIEQLDDNYAYWIEYSENERGENVSLKNKPIYINEFLKEICWKDFNSIIFLSATLTVGKNSFDFIINTLGLNNDIEKFICDSPFNYQEQCGLIVPRDIPVPVYTKEEEFKEKFLESVQKAIKYSDGRAMVLFTSYGHLKYFYENCKDVKNKYKVLAQGSGELNRSKMIEEFKSDISSVLLGTSSFWEGIDVQGEALSLLVIDKIPFPNIKQDPVLDAMQERNEKFFFEEYLPRAILSLKQGVGRLIRSKTDKGCVVICDQRILPGVKAYSQTILNSLPQMGFGNNVDLLNGFFK